MVQAAGQSLTNLLVSSGGIAVLGWASPHITLWENSTTTGHKKQHEGGVWLFWV